MKIVKVFLYAYKSKDLFENISSMIDNQSGQNKVIYYVFDQGNLNRDRLFSSLGSVKYNFITWDDTKGVPIYRNQALFDSSSDYFLEISSDTAMCKNWDTVLIDLLPKKSVLSGKAKVDISIKNFDIVVNKKVLDTTMESNYIDFNMLFLEYSDSILLNQLKSLKFNGQELYATVLYLNLGYKIFSVPNSTYSLNPAESNLTYYPYSRDHGYNKMISTIKSIKSKGFEDAHGLLINDIPHLPYQVDDVSYHKVKTSLESGERLKFHGGYSGVKVL